MPRLLALALSLAALIPSARPAHAQAASTLPTTLVAALLAGGSYERAVPDSFYIGRTPPGWPASLTPPGIPVVGGSARRGALVAVFADTAPDALARYHAMLAQAGWTQPASPTVPGFQSARQNFAFFCHDSARVTPLLVSNSRRGTNLYVSLHPSTMGVCGATLARPRMSSPFDHLLEFPVLTPPAGATSTREGSGASDNEVSARARIEDTTLSPAQLVAHYGAQLSAAGWTAGARLSGDEIATQVFTARDKDQRRWQGVFTIMTNGASRNASLSMHVAADK